ncbi:hypothetical protein DSO57_1018556 [Entomophthora muscae]|uniref:Uncharacterized protein n=1 Tax=Entomophthora muscae TaxID=34485 RepID=A0ACC2TF44_9FUNG|nr:hypothetical protein DSO57_1018556 [Entomophthora muscae]
MTPPLTTQPNCPMETPTAAKTTSTQLFGVLYINLTGMVDTMVPNSGPWSFLGQSYLSYGGHYPLAWQYPVQSHLIPPPIPGFLIVLVKSYGHNKIVELAENLLGGFLFHPSELPDQTLSIFIHYCDQESFWQLYWL